MTASIREVNPFYTARTQREARHQPSVATFLFPPGEITFSGTATVRLRTEEVLSALQRHAAGDWGDLLPEDTLANYLALKQGGRLFSAYGVGRERFWIITEDDRSRTTVLLPDDA